MRGELVKRFLLGRPLATARLEHERLGKPTALAVFASDNLSSSAYATEEILRVLVPAVGVAAFALVVPITFALLGVLAILLFSYRQTIKAYPTAGGAYIVTKDNFGPMLAQVAGVALLTDYVLTVSVSVAAGVQALSSVAEGVHPYRVPVAAAFIWIVAWGNLRGVRESGRLFAVPTYLFVVSMFAMLGTGLVRAIAGTLPEGSTAPQEGALSFGTGAVAIFLVLRAFASGGAAVTGVEAISNGVPAFRRPAWRNARTTLMWMGSLLAAMFLGISILVAHLHVAPVADESKTVLAQIAETVYGGDGVGQTLFLVLQAATMLILVLAANTSFAGFPRLASVQAGDDFLPRQFTKRGHRLVFSTGIVALAVASTLLVVAFNASVTNLIPLYAIGVFTSFTLSQAGMARRHLRLREPGWRPGLVINGLGALTTTVVAVVILIVKFKPPGSFGGAWMILVAVPVLVFLLVRLNRQYEQERRELSEGLAEGLPEGVRRTFVVVVDALDERTLHAVQYALTAGARRLRLIHPETNSAAAAALEADWRRRGPDQPLVRVPCPGGNRAEGIRRFFAGLRASGDEVTVIVPGPARLSFWRRVRHGRTGERLTRLIDDPGVIVTVVREHGGRGHAVDVGGSGRYTVRARPDHRVVVMVDRVDRSTIQALRYAKSLNALEVTALHVAVDPEGADALLRSWSDTKLPVALEAVYCPDRNIGRCTAQNIARLQGPGSEVTLVIPRRDYRRAWHRLLHDRTSRTIANAVADLAHVDVVVVPYRLGGTDARPAPGPDEPPAPVETPAPALTRAP